MEKSVPKYIEDLMAEADELIHRIQADVGEDIEESHRLEIEAHASKLDALKSELAGPVDEAAESVSHRRSGAEGMHEAIDDIVKAMKHLKDKMF